MSVLNKWVPVRGDRGELYGMKCSNCGRRVSNKGENYCPKCGSKMIMPSVTSKEHSKEIDIEFKAVGVEYSEDNGLPVGLILDNGFTLRFQDNDGNTLSLNPEAIGKWRNMCNEIARGN